jgi:CheY-like chemotaxis protein
MSDLSKYKVLVVDDSAANIDILVDTLARDYDVSVAMSGEEALQDAVENHPDLILLDIMMPGMDGYEVCQHLKADVETYNIPVIFVSSLQETEDKVRGLSLGAVDFITKPFVVDEVLARVQRQLEVYADRCQLAEQNKELMQQTSRQNLGPEERGDFVRMLVDTGENDFIEFKSTLRWSIEQGKVHAGVEFAWLKTIVAFLNSKGGTLAVGIDDQGQVVGYEKDNFESEDKYLLYVCSRINQNIGLEHARNIRYSLEPVEQTKVLIIECSPSSAPVFLHQGKNEFFFIRVGPSTRELTTSQVLKYMAARQKE